MERKWRPNPRPQDIRVGKFFMLSDFLYSESAATIGIRNCPLLRGDEVDGMKGLCSHILDPVVKEFGPLSITFGYISPELDQYAGSNRPEISALHRFHPNQGGIGGAADILVHSHPENPRPVLNWIRDNCVYDRLILFPGSPILCVAWTANKPRYECKEWIFPESGGLAEYVNAGRERPPHSKRRSKVEQGKLFRRRIRSLLHLLF